MKESDYVILQMTVSSDGEEHEDDVVVNGRLLVDEKREVKKIE